MTRISQKDNTISPNAERPSSSGSMDPKTPSGSAMLAQRLGSEASWADRYVPGTPGETIMTPGTSIADHSDRGEGSEYVTPHEAPPSYEEVTSSNAPSQAPSYPRDLAPPLQAPTSLPQRPQLPGRHYSRHESSQSIFGTFTLYDSLDLSTKSGSINIKLDVQPGSEPARLNLKSASGSISVTDNQCDIALTRPNQSSSRIGSRSISGNTGNNNSGLLSFLWGSSSSTRSDSSTSTQVYSPPVPTSDDPRKQPGQHLQQADPDMISAAAARVIHTTIETASGSTNVQLLLTPNSITSIKTVAGSIHLRLITADSSTSSWSRAPVDKLSAEDSRNPREQDEPSCTLTTTSNSGSQHITVVTGSNETSPGKLISSIRAQHHALGSSSIHCTYPREWEGLVHASVGGSGSVNVKGEGLQYDRRGNKEVWAWRGREGELPDIEKAVQVRGEGSGSISFNC